MNAELLNQLIDPKYTIKQDATLYIYNIYHQRNKHHQPTYLGHLIYNKEYIIISMITDSRQHTISYNDPDYQNKVNQIIYNAPFS